MNTKGGEMVGVYLMYVGHSSSSAHIICGVVISLYFCCF